MWRTMEDRWYFTKEQLNSTPSIRYGYSPDRELSCRQQAANFIQDMGQRLQVTQLCINTAIVYMHRFYMFHSFTQFHRTAISSASLFLAAKVEEQPRKLEHVIKVAYMCLHREQSQHLDTKSEQYLELAQDLVVNENVLLQTLGFDVAIDHPHTHVVQCCRLVKACKDLAQTSYFMASNSLHLTTMCLQYKPTLVACFCIHLAVKWSNLEIPQSSEGRPWFWYVDSSVTSEQLEQLTAEFLVIFDKCPSRLKRKIMAMSASQNPALLSNYPPPEEKKHKQQQQDNLLPSTSGISQQLNQQVRSHMHNSLEESRQKDISQMPGHRPPHNYKKMVPGQHQHHSHSMKTLGHPPHSSSTIPPKKNINRPPDCMFPPPIRISDHARAMKTDPHRQLPNRQPSSHVPTDPAQKPEPKAFLSSSHHNQPQTTSTPPLPQPQPNKFNPPPKKYEVPHHQKQHTEPASSYLNAFIKQEEQVMENHRYEDYINVHIKEEPVQNHISHRQHDQNHHRLYDNFNATVKQEKIKEEKLEPMEQNHRFDYNAVVKQDKTEPMDQNHRTSKVPEKDDKNNHYGNGHQYADDSHGDLYKKEGYSDQVSGYASRLPMSQKSHHQPQQVPQFPLTTSIAKPSVPPVVIPSGRSTKAPSIFSPEKDPPQPPRISPPPVLKEPSPIKQTVEVPNKLKRKRISSSSEPEFVPVVKRLEPEEIAMYEEGYKNKKTSVDRLMNSSSTATNNDSWNFETDVARQEIVKPSTSNSIETELGATIEIGDVNDKKHKEGREHKKKKKHKEHKEHKDREKHRHKEKHKSKDKHREKDVSGKEAINEPQLSKSQVNSPASSSGIERSSLKIKIPKEKLVQAMPGLKVKISKDLLQSINKPLEKHSQESSGIHRNSMKVSSNRHESSR